jgi:hypothetical protein
VFQWKHVGGEYILLINVFSLHFKAGLTVVEQSIAF